MAKRKPKKQMLEHAPKNIYDLLLTQHIRNQNKLYNRLALLVGIEKR